MNPKNTLKKEVTLWRKRYNDSRKALTTLVRDLEKEARKIYKETTK